MWCACLRACVRVRSLCCVVVFVFCFFLSALYCGEIEHFRNPLRYCQLPVVLSPLFPLRPSISKEENLSE